MEKKTKWKQKKMERKGEKSSKQQRFGCVGSVNSKWKEMFSFIGSKQITKLKENTSYMSDTK